MKTALVLLSLFLVCYSIASDSQNEEHLANIRQLTFGGENAEAYFSADGKQLIYQSTGQPHRCDQIFTMKVDGTDRRLVSTGKGRTTCAYFLRDRNRILYSSTHESSVDCPPPPDRSQGYVWALYPYDIYTAKPDGSDVQSLAPAEGYDAEATISPDGKTIVFTSDRDGDLELYTMNVDGSNLRRVTNFPGYDGGAFFSADSKKIVFRGNHITDPKELNDYQSLLKRRLVRPVKLEIYVMDADGKNVRQVTRNGAANFCPYFHPDGKRIVFASNVNDPAGRNFDLFIISTDGTGLRQITFNSTFDGFPMFSPDGTKLVFASNRNARVQGETNIFIADWVEPSSDIAEKQSSVAINETNIRKDINFLASDELKGRLTGTVEARKAAEYIAEQFKKAGLQNPPGMNAPFQKFEFTSGVKLGSPNALMLEAGGKKTSYKLQVDYIPTGFSSDGALQHTPVVFAGYGIRAPDAKYDDYQGIDVKGKAVFCYRFGPEGDDPKSQYASYYPIRYKAMTAREQGAAALLVMADNDKENELLQLRKDASFGTAGIPVLSVKREVLMPWLKAANLELPNVRKNPHETSSFEIPALQLTLQSNLIREKSHSDNVLGWLPAATKTEHTIVIGAHYDHLGLGAEGSLAGKWGEVHNGADDNASGTSGLLELARYFGSHRNSVRRNLLFIAFGGEELGVLGSSYFVKNPVVPLKQIIAMLNMDMIGRMRDKKLVVGGTGTSPAWKDLLQAANLEGLNLSMTEDGYGPSDHAVFYTREIPVLFFFTGAHSEYHKPGDDAEKIEYPALVQVVDYVRRVAQKIDELPEPPKYVQVKSTTQGIASRGFRVYLGTIPDYTEEVKGVKLSGVRQGSPAQKAGMQSGDVIVEFAGKKIENVYDYTYALQEHKPGDSVTVVVLRGSQRVPLKVALEKRSATE